MLVGLLGSLYAAAQFVGGPFLGGLSDRAGRRSVLILCLLGASLAYLLLGLADSLPLLIAAVALAGLASATLANAQAYIADVTPPSQSRAWKLKTARFAVSSLRHIAFPVVSEWYQEVMDYHSSNTPE